VVLMGAARQNIRTIGKTIAFVGTCCLLLLSLAFACPLFAQQPGDGNLPRIGMAMPLAIPATGTAKVTLRGWQLDGVKEIKVSDG